MAGGLAGGVFTEEFGVIALREIQGEDLGFDFAGDAAEVPVLDVATDVDAAGCVFVLDDVGGGDDAKIGDVAQRNVGAGRSVDAEFAESFGLMPTMTIEKIGYGLGTRELAKRPNVLRAVLGTTA